MNYIVPNDPLKWEGGVAGKSMYSNKYEAPKRSFSYLSSPYLLLSYVANDRHVTNLLLIHLKHLFLLKIMP